MHLLVPQRKDILQDVRLREPGADGVDVDLVRRILERDGLGHLEHRPLGRGVRTRPGHADEAEDRAEVDDPAAVAGGVRGLGEHLRDGVLVAEPDAPRVDGLVGVVDGDGAFVGAAREVAGLGGDAGVVYLFRRGC